MSIHNNEVKSNRWAGERGRQILMGIVFVAFCLLSFAIGRISAFNENSSGKTPIRIINSNFDKKI